MKIRRLLVGSTLTVLGGCLIEAFSWQAPDGTVSGTDGATGTDAANIVDSGYRIHSKKDGES